ncbi:MAG: Gfo/Idh/MocA family oxidoreductase [Eubacteriales bacterium]
MADKLKLLLAGIGGYGAGYVMTAMGMEDEIEVVGIIDPFAANSNAFDSVEDLPLFNTIDEYFAAGNTAEAIVISTPIQLHCEHLCSALEHGLHVLCEKPLCASLEEAEIMLEASKNHPEQKVLIGFQWSFSPAILEAKKQILAGTWGKPLSMKAIVRWPRAFSYYERNDWAGRKFDSKGNFVGDSIISNATAHYLHNPLFMLGGTMELSAEPSKIEAECFKAYDIETFDTAFVKLSVPNKQGSDTKVFIAVSHCSEETAEPTIEYTFENGRMWCAGDDRLHGVHNDQPVEFGIIGSNLEGYYNKLTWLCECVQNDDASPCTPQTALQELRVANYILNNIPIKRFAEGTIEEFNQPMKERRLKVNGLDSVLLDCYNKMLLPSETSISL